MVQRLLNIIMQRINIRSREFIMVRISSDLNSPKLNFLSNQGQIISVK